MKPVVTVCYLFCSNLVPLKCKLPGVAGSELDVDESWGEFREELVSKEAAWKKSIWWWGAVTPVTVSHTGDTPQHFQSHPCEGDQQFL